MVGLIDKQEHVTKSQVEETGLKLILLGGWSSELRKLLFADTVRKKEGTVPEVSLENEKKVQDLLITQIEAGKIIAAHDLSEGGLLVCLAKFFGENKLGASLSIPERRKVGRHALWRESGAGACCSQFI